MPTPTATTVSWTLSGVVATTTAATTTARLDLAAPAAGLRLAETGRADQLLGIDLGGSAAPPADHWTRGPDLTAVYEPDDTRRLRATAMWRARPGSRAAWELVVSAQTALLHADPALAVVSDVACDRALWGTVAAAGCRWTPLEAAGPLPAEAALVLARRGVTSILMAVHPQDPRRIEVALADGRARVRCGIFPCALEKGVILRSRVLAAVGPAADDETWADALAAAFASSPPFLDT